MTLILSCTCEHFAILASDTRGMWYDPETNERVGHTDTTRKILLAGRPPFSSDSTLAPFARGSLP